MKHFVGLDVGVASTSLCVLNEVGDVVHETAIATKVDAIAGVLGKSDLNVVRLGLEAGSCGEWLCEGLAAEGLPAIMINANYAHAVLSQRINKTDRNDARGIAEIMRAGAYRSVYVKSAQGQQLRDLLTARRLLQTKSIDLERSIVGILRARGISVERVRSKGFETSVRAAIAHSPGLRTALKPLMAVRKLLRSEFEKLDLAVHTAARRDPVCKRLMTAPGVGPIAALTYRAVIDNPHRFQRSKDVAAYAGLTPRTRQSGVTDFRGRISKHGNKHLRVALYGSALSILSHTLKSFDLKTWAQAVAGRRGARNARIALARRLCVILHLMWKNGEDFRLGVGGV